jgi:hypothetical protein
MKFSALIIGIIIQIIKAAGNIDYKFAELDSTPVDLVWCGNSKEVVLVLTETNSLYRSDDKGFTWKKLNDVFIKTGTKELEENENEIGQVSRILESPVDKTLVIFLGTHGINWIGKDCGKKIEALNHGRKIQEFVFHPTERDWGLASAFTLCEDFVDEPCKIYKELFVTRDLGNSWEIIGSYIVQFGWGITGENHIKAGVPKERVLVSFEPRAKGDQKQLGWNYKVDFYYSDDFFKTKKVAVHKGNKYLLTDNYLFVAQVVDQEAQEVVLLVANSTDSSYTFETMETNKKKFQEHSYTFLDHSENSVFLNINHFGEKSKYGHIYTSDIKGLKYSLSLRYNVRSADGRSDFLKIHAMEGLFIANSIDKDYMKEAEQEMEEEIMENNEMGATGEQKTKKIDQYKNHIKSLITFNKGGSWYRLKAPARDNEGKKYECEKNCHLNLHALSGEFPPFYSVESATGIIIGNGNVGKYLSHDASDISTFLSRDGGVSWFEIRKGSHIYEIGDHGALIVIADDQNPTDKVLYTWDEGLTWHELQISNEKMMVKNIIIDPNSISQNFVVYGEKTKNGEKKGVAVAVDFKGLHEPQCRNPSEPDTANSDYEKWTPTDINDRECIMGRKRIIVRRKREAECYNGETFERTFNVQNCDCTETDYECDVGFSRSDADEPCTSDDKKRDTGILIQKPPANCNGYFEISQGYRKVPGNTCVNGVKFDPIRVSCPFRISSALGMFLIGSLAVGVIALVYAFFSNGFMQNVSEFVKEKMKDNNQSGKRSEYIDIVKYF